MAVIQSTAKQTIMQNIEQLLKENKPTWANYGVIETYGIDGFRIVYFESQPFRDFTGKYICDNGKMEIINLSAAKNILFEI